VKNVVCTTTLLVWQDFTTTNTLRFIVSSSVLFMRVAAGTVNKTQPKCLVPSTFIGHIYIATQKASALLTGLYVWWAVCFKIVNSKNAVCVPTNRNYIDSMVNKIDLICTTFDSIIQGGVHQLDFMKIELIRASFDSIIHGGENRLDSHSGKNRLDHSKRRYTYSYENRLDHSQQVISKMQGNYYT